MEHTTKLFICVLPGKTDWWRWDTLSWNMKTSKEQLIKDGVLTWKDCLKNGWKCVQVEINIKTLKQS